MPKQSYPLYTTCPVCDHYTQGECRICGSTGYVKSGLSTGQMDHVMTKAKMPKTRKALGLLSSMVNGGESHSDASRECLKEAWDELDELANPLGVIEPLDPDELLLKAKALHEATKHLPVHPDLTRDELAHAICSEDPDEVDKSVCTFCGSRNTNELEDEVYECYDCGEEYE